MSIVPITRDELKQLKIQADEEKRKADEEKRKADEEKRKADIKSTIEYVYNKVISTVKTEGFTKCFLAIYDNAINHSQFSKHDFGNLFRNEGDGCFNRPMFSKPIGYHILNIKYDIFQDILKDIMDGLRELFPDSKVTFMAWTPNGNFGDVPDSAIPFINSNRAKGILIDWS